MSDICFICLFFSLSCIYGLVSLRDSVVDCAEFYDRDISNVIHPVERKKQRKKEKNALKTIWFT